MPLEWFQGTALLQSKTAITTKKTIAKSKSDSTVDYFGSNLIDTLAQIHKLFINVDTYKTSVSNTFETASYRPYS